MTSLEKARSALLVMDFQNYNVDPQGYWALQAPGWPARASGAIVNAARVLTAARKATLPVIHIGNAWREGHPEANLSAPWQAAARAANRSVERTWAVDFYPALKPSAGELVIYKRGVSALAGTELDRFLRIKGVTTIVLAGVVTNGVVEGTAREASDRGYRVIVLEDCCAAQTDEEHDHSTKLLSGLIGTVIGADEFIRWLEQTSPSRVNDAQLEENKSVMRLFIEEFLSGHNPEVLDELLGPDFVNRTRPTAPDRAGLQEVGRLFFSAFPDFRVAMYDMISEGDLVAVRKILEGTHQGDFLGIPPSGKHVTFSVIDFSRFRGGKMVEHWSEGTAEAEILQQLASATAKEPRRT
jgi:nicotinamidase-related amidase/predicted ester cyclase